MIYEKDVDIYFQKENLVNGRINMGFMGIKNNERSKKLFKELYNLSLPNNLWDQPTLDQMLHDNLSNEVKYKQYSPKDENGIAHYINNENNLIWDTFPTEICNWSIYVSTNPQKFPRNVHLHHANCTVTKNQKNDQFERVKNLLN